MVRSTEQTYFNRFSNCRLRVSDLFRSRLYISHWFQSTTTTPRCSPPKIATAQQQLLWVMGVPTVFPHLGFPGFPTTATPPHIFRTSHTTKIARRWNYIIEPHTVINLLTTVPARTGGCAPSVRCSILAAGALRSNDPLYCLLLLHHCYPTVTIVGDWGNQWAPGETSVPF